MGKNGCGCSGGGSKSGSKCGCGGGEIISIPRGNDFRLHVCGLDVVTGMMDEDIDLTEVEDMRVYLVTWLGRRWEAEHLSPTLPEGEGDDLPGVASEEEGSEDGEEPKSALSEDSQGLTWETNGKDIIITVPAELQKCTVYAIEVTGTHQGRPFRWKTRGLFRIVETHCESSVQGMETFGTEDYYLLDELWVGEKDDAMIFTSHGHVRMEDGTLDIQSTDKTTVTVEGDALVFTVSDDAARWYRSGVR